MSTPNTPFYPEEFMREMLNQMAEKFSSPDYKPLDLQEDLSNEIVKRLALISRIYSDQRIIHEFNNETTRKLKIESLILSYASKDLEQLKNELAELQVYHEVILYKLEKAESRIKHFVDDEQARKKKRILTAENRLVRTGKSADRTATSQIMKEVFQEMKTSGKLHQNCFKNYCEEVRRRRNERGINFQDVHNNTLRTNWLHLTGFKSTKKIHTP